MVSVLWFLPVTVSFSRFSPAFFRLGITATFKVFLCAWVLSADTIHSFKKYLSSTYCLCQASFQVLSGYDSAQSKKIPVLTGLHCSGEKQIVIEINLDNISVLDRKCGEEKKKAGAGRTGVGETLLEF